MQNFYVDISRKFGESGETYIGIFSNYGKFKIIFTSSLKSRLKWELKKYNIKKDYIYEKLYAISIFITIKDHVTDGDQIFIDLDYSERVKAYLNKLIEAKPINCRIIVCNLKHIGYHEEPHMIARQKINAEKRILSQDKLKAILSYINILSS